MAGPAVAEGVRRMRLGQVELSPGYDGEYGKIKLLDPQEIETLAGQMSLFGSSSRPAPKKKAPAAPRPARAAQKAEEVSAAPSEGGALAGLNEEQRAAVTATEPAVAVVAGPGTGKTRTLVARVAWLVGQGVKPAQITAVTFTNKAAGEMRERLEALFGKRAVRAMTIGTFHAICLRLLSEQGPVSLIGEGEALAAASEVIGALDLRLSARKLVQEVSRRKGGLPADGSVPVEACERYCELLKEAGVRDYDDLLLDAYDLFVHGEATAKERRAFTHLLVDEFQDVSDVQYRLVRTWSGESAGVFVIGDPDQSIYGFRGSDAGASRALPPTGPPRRPSSSPATTAPPRRFCGPPCRSSPKTGARNGRLRPSGRTAAPCGSSRRRTNFQKRSLWPRRSTGWWAASTCLTHRAAGARSPGAFPTLQSSTGPTGRPRRWKNASASKGFPTLSPGGTSSCPTGWCGARSAFSGAFAALPIPSPCAPA